MDVDKPKLNTLIQEVIDNWHGHSEDEAPQLEEDDIQEMFENASCEDLRAALREHPDMEWRAVAALVLGCLGYEEALPDLRRARWQGDSWLREVATFAANRFDCWLYLDDLWVAVARYAEAHLSDPYQPKLF